MSSRSSRRLAVVSALLACVIAARCDHRCGLAEHERVTVKGDVAAAGASDSKDVALKASTSDPEFSLSNTAFPSEAGGVDAFIVPTSCQKLFDGPYPGAAPLCSILAGPAKPGAVSGRVKLASGSYRVYLQGYSNVDASVKYLVDVYVWDYRCGGIIQ